MIVMMAITIATIGRLTKNLEIMKSILAQDSGFRIQDSGRKGV
jgi:hypothetical protein